MKIAQIVCVFWPYQGGIAKVASLYASSAADNGHLVVVFTPNYGTKVNSQKFNFKIIRVKPLLKYGNGAFIPQLVHLLRDFDLVHLHYPFFGGAEPVWLAKLINKNKFKLIVHYHMDVTGLPLIAKFLRWPTNLIKPSLLKITDAVTCASIDYIENSLLSNIYKKYKNKFFEIPFAVDMDRFAPLGNYQETIKKAKKILFVGGLDKAHYFKGLDNLLKALEKLKTNDWRLDIIGEGELKEEYIKQSKELMLNEKVCFQGAVSQASLIKAYQDADLFVLPSVNSNEAFGIVLLEAMACGTPVLASDLPGVRRVFTDNVHGCLAQAGDIDDLSSKIAELLSNDQLRQKMAVEARKLVEERYGLKIMSKKLNSIYEFVMSKK